MHSRTISSNGKQEVAGLGGFISATGVAPAKKTTIDYYTPIHQPITQYETIPELLERSEEATAAVGQEYVINTFDLGVCMKALAQQQIQFSKRGCLNFSGLQRLLTDSSSSGSVALLRGRSDALVM